MPSHTNIPNTTHKTEGRGSVLSCPAKVTPADPAETHPVQGHDILAEGVQVAAPMAHSVMKDCPILSGKSLLLRDESVLLTVLVQSVDAGSQWGGQVSSLYTVLVF